MFSSDPRKYIQVLALLLLHDTSPSACFSTLLGLCCLPPQPNHKLKQPEPIYPIHSYIPVTRRFHRSQRWKTEPLKSAILRHPSQDLTTAWSGATHSTHTLPEPMGPRLLPGDLTHVVGGRKRSKSQLQSWMRV